MLTLPNAIISILKPFAPMFQAKTWTKAHVLLVGAVLATSKRAVTSALRIMGLSDDTSFARLSSRPQPRRVVADSSYAALDPLAFWQSISSTVTFITGLRMDAALYEPAPLSTAMTDRASAHQRPTAAHPQGTRRPTDNPPDRRDDPLVRRYHCVEWRLPLIQRSGITAARLQSLSVGS